MEFLHTKIQHRFLNGLKEKTYSLQTSYTDIAKFGIVTETSGNMKTWFYEMFRHLMAILKIQFTSTAFLPPSQFALDFYMDQVYVSLMSLFPKYDEKGSFYLALDASGILEMKPGTFPHFQAKTMISGGSGKEQLLPVWVEIFTQVLRETITFGLHFTHSSEMRIAILECIVDDYDYVSNIFDLTKHVLHATSKVSDGIKSFESKYMTILHMNLQGTYFRYIVAIEAAISGKQYGEIGDEIGREIYEYFKSRLNGQKNDGIHKKNTSMHLSGVEPGLFGRSFSEDFREFPNTSDFTKEVGSMVKIPRGMTELIVTKEKISFERICKLLSTQTDILTLDECEFIECETSDPISHSHQITGYPLMLRIRNSKMADFAVFPLIVIRNLKYVEVSNCMELRTYVDFPALTHLILKNVSYFYSLTIQNSTESISVLISENCIYNSDSRLKGRNLETLWLIHHSHESMVKILTSIEDRVAQNIKEMILCWKVQHCYYTQQVVSLNRFSNLQSLVLRNLQPNYISTRNEFKLGKLVIYVRGSTILFEILRKYRKSKNITLILESKVKNFDGLDSLENKNIKVVYK